MMSEFDEVYKFETTDGMGAKTTREFVANDLHAFVYNVLQFTNQAGYSYVDAVTMYSANKEWSAEN